MQIDLNKYIGDCIALIGHKQYRVKVERTGNHNVFKVSGRLERCHRIAQGGWVGRSNGKLYPTFDYYNADGTHHPRSNKFIRERYRPKINIDIIGLNR